jgi:hypothetical protein
MLFYHRVVSCFFAAVIRLSRKALVQFCHGGRSQRSDAAEYCFEYIDQVSTDNVVKNSKSSRNNPQALSYFVFGRRFTAPAPTIHIPRIGSRPTISVTSSILSVHILGCRLQELRHSPKQQQLPRIADSIANTREQRQQLNSHQQHTRRCDRCRLSITSSGSSHVNEEQYRQNGQLQPPVVDCTPRRHLSSGSFCCRGPRVSDRQFLWPGALWQESERAGSSRRFNSPSAIPTIHFGFHRDP